MMAKNINVCEYIDKAFLQNALKLKNYGNGDKLEVTDYSVVSAVDKGESNTCDIYRVTVALLVADEKTETKSLIVKLSPTVGVKREMVEKMNLFTREIRVMTDNLVKMNDLLKDLDEDVLSADLYCARVEFPAVLVMDDLMTKGYRLADRIIGLDLAHSELVMKSLAKFHATSLVYLENEALDQDLFRIRKYDTRAGESIKHFFRDCFITIGEELRNWSEVDPRHPEKVIEMADGAHERCSLVVMKNNAEFNVINHGDCWVNNIMFRYDEANIRAVQQIFLDFQFSCYSSPANDIAFFFATSLSEQVYHNCREHLVNLYHVNLISLMRRLECKTKPPSIDELNDAIGKRAFYELMATFFTRPRITAHKEDAVDICDFSKGDNFAGLVRNPDYRKSLTKRLVLFDKLGLFD